MIEKKVNEYIAKQERWADALTILRNLILSTELKEEVKWGMPTYTLDKKIVVTIAGFKNHFCLWFHQGVYLKDAEKLLLNAQKGKTQAMRQMRFESKKDIKKRIVKSYVKEAIQNQKEGKALPKAKVVKSFKMAPLLKEALSKNKKLNKAFEELSFYKRKDYSNYINEAKRESTKLSRLEKIKPLISQGKGLMDKYNKK